MKALGAMFFSNCYSHLVLLLLWTCGRRDSHLCGKYSYSRQNWYVFGFWTI